MDLPSGALDPLLGEDLAELRRPALLKFGGLTFPVMAPMELFRYEGEGSPAGVKDGAEEGGGGPAGVVEGCSAVKE
jgi:hypothetical protein